MRTPIRPLLLSGMVLAAAVAFSPICSAQPDQGAPTLATSNSSGGTTSAAPGATKRTSAPAKNSPRVSALRGFGSANQATPGNNYTATAALQTQLIQLNQQNQLMLRTQWGPPVIFLAS